MAEIKWKYVSPLQDETELTVLELQYCFLIPDDLKECIMENNAGVPSVSTLDIGGNVRKVFGGLLSFNKDDVDSFFDYVTIFESDDRKGLKMFPFAIDPAGNFFCIENGKVVLYNHESDQTTIVSNTFTDLLHKLYE